MKQHITDKQLNELSIDAKIKLRTWLLQNCPSKEDDYIQLANLTIGQMIEFLKEHCKLVDTQSWIKYGSVIYGEDKKNKQSEELCDALWEAVKEVVSG
jgi:hypothetical protein